MSDDTRQDIHNSDIPLICRACEARHQGVCGALNPDQLTRLSKHTLRRNVENGAELFSAEEETERYSNIMSGVVKLSKLMADGRQQIVGLQFAPDFVGRPFSGTNQVSAEAATPVHVCSFPKTIIEELLAEAPEMEHRLHQQTLKELDEARDWLLTLGRKSAAEKVASFLYLIATHIDPERPKSDNSIIMDLPMKRAEIADFLGLTIETVSRQMTHLRKSGLIDIPDRKSVRIPDIQRLKAATERDLS